MPAVNTEQVKQDVIDHGGLIRDQRMDVDLLGQGMLVRISVHGTTIFDRSLRLEELGISSKDPELRKYITPGHKSYAPDYSKKLGSWGTLCRQAVDRYCLHLDSVDALTASRSWRFLMFDAYGDFKARWDELQRMRAEILSDIEYEYDQLVEDAILFYQDQLGESFDRLQQRYRSEGGIAIYIEGHGQTFGPGDRQAYIDWVGEYIENDFPPMAAIRENVYAECLVNFMFDSASVESAQAEAEEARARQEVALTEAAEASERRWELETTREARERAIRQAELERMRQRVAEVADPFAEAMDQLLKELAGHINALLSGFDKHGSFKGRSLGRVDSMIELFRVMGGKNLGDKDLERVLQELEAKRQESPDDETRENWTTSIADGLVNLRAKVRGQSEIIERRMQAQTRAGALEL